MENVENLIEVVAKATVCHDDSRLFALIVQFVHLHLGANHLGHLQFE